MNGGHAERIGVVALIIAFILTYASQACVIGELRIGRRPDRTSLLICLPGWLALHPRPLVADTRLRRTWC